MLDFNKRSVIVVQMTDFSELGRALFVASQFHEVFNDTTYTYRVRDFSNKDSHYKPFTDWIQTQLPEGTFDNVDNLIVEVSW